MVMGEEEEEEEEGRFFSLLNNSKTMNGTVLNDSLKFLYYNSLNDDEILFRKKFFLAQNWAN